MNTITRYLYLIHIKDNFIYYNGQFNYERYFRTTESFLTDEIGLNFWYKAFLKGWIKDFKDWCNK